ncbi:unnamed protein product, partial [Brassica oleracea]
GTCPRILHCRSAPGGAKSFTFCPREIDDVGVVNEPTPDTEPNDQQVTLVGRAIYYVLGVSSLICLSNSIGDVWPSKKEDGTLIEIPNSKYAAVVLASLYAIGLARTLFFDRPPRCHKIGPYVEMFYSLCLFITAFVIAFTYRSDPDVRIFAMSVITCTIAILQLTHPLEEFYVGKTLFVILWTAFVTECFNGGSKDVVMGFIGGFCLVSIGIASHLSINDLMQRITQV